VKFNFKKIASVIASTVMLSSTVALAAAANYPSPFVQNGVADVAVVYGANAAQTDMLAATDITVSLNSGLVSQAATTGGSATVTGEAKAVETSGQKLYLGDYMNTTKQSFTKTELPTVLADGNIVDTDGVGYDYSLKINVPNTVVKYGRPSSFSSTDAPVLYVDFGTSSQSYSQEIIFPTAVNVTKLADKDITLFGQKFSFSGNPADLTSTKVVLYASANTQFVKSGESATMVVGGTSYTIEVNAVEDATTADITVNGVSQKVVETNSYKVAGLDMYVKNVIYASYAGKLEGVELTAGSAKLTLESGNSVTKGANSVYGTTTTITNSGTKVSKIAISVQPYSLDNAVKYLRTGDAFTDPVFGAFKMTFASYTPAADDTSKDLITLKSDGESKASLKWTNKVGGAYDMDMFVPSNVLVNANGVANVSDLYGATAANLANYLYNATKLGYDTYDVIASTSGAVNESDFFITNNNEFSQIFRVDRIDINNKKVRVKDQASGSSLQEVSLDSNSVGATASLSLADGSSATLTLVANLSGSLSINVSKASPILYTSKGAKIDLTNLADPVLNNQTNKIVMTEETAYNDGTFTNNVAGTLGTTINDTILYKASQGGNDMKVSDPTVGGLVSGDSGSTVGDYNKQWLDTYGSYVVKTGNSNSDSTIDIHYPGTAASLGVYIGELATSVSGGGISNILPITDSEAASVTAKNLVVVGGSCINSVAADLLGGALCGADFETKTGVGAGAFLIETFSRTGGGVATLVAGYNAADTTSAVKYLTTKSVDTTVGSLVKKKAVTFEALA
jgi:hypothetical protein